MHLKGIVHGQYSAESLCDQVSVRTQIAVKTAFHLYILFLRNETNEKKQNSFWNKKTTTWWTLLQKNQIRTGKNLNTTSNCIFRILRFDHIERARTVFLSTDCYGQRRTRFAIVFRIVFLFSIIFFFLRAWCCKTEQQPRRQRHCQREKNIKEPHQTVSCCFASKCERIYCENWMPAETRTLTSRLWPDRMIWRKNESMYIKLFDTCCASSCLPTLSLNQLSFERSHARTSYIKPRFAYIFFL